MSTGLRKTTKKATLDEADVRILRVLQLDANLSHAEISRRVHLSPSSVRRRVEALTHAGYIRAIVALVDPHLTNVTITVVVTITFERESKELYEEFARRMVRQGLVTQCYFVAGATDAVLVVVASSIAEYWEWVERELKSHAHVRRFDSLFVSRTAKYSTRLPI